MCWMCKDCLHKNGSSLIGLPIRVWWTDDAVFYCGIIDAFDSFSCIHRVCYDDDEWEFVDLSAEPYIVGIPDNFDVVVPDRKWTAGTNTTRSSARTR